mmetsp:Transcript_39315/g.69151  ORF Transcript_39315/g.69151 Transcript_39315/m.69151 type:complete len:510 (-) Transcript_39315:79-1608(-)
MRISGAVVGLVASLVQIHVRVTWAQIYQMQDVAVPSNRSLHTLYAFYIFSHEEAPERSLGNPFVKFHDLRMNGGALLKDYQGVQLSIMKYTDFWNLISPHKFCCTYDDAQKGACNAKDQLLVQKPPGTSYIDVDVYSYTVTAANVKDMKIPVRRTGVYILVFSNCGDFSDATVGGSVIVKNAYGFLPGNEYHKMPFYGWLLLTYVFLAVCWMVLSLRWWKEMFNIQNCISAVIFFGLVEAFLWYVFFNDWNNSGVRGKALFILSILSSVVKSIFSYMLVLVAALGWGVTRPYLDRQVIMKIQAVCFLYIVLDFIRESVLSFRHSHSLSLAFVLLCLLPVSLLNGGIFYWVFTALSSLMETLRDRRQFEKLALFQRLWKILIFALAVATATLLFQIFNLSRSITTRWKYQWLFADGVSHVLFLVVLAAMMYLWAPHKYSQRYAYSQQIDNDEKEMQAPEGAQDVWAEEGGLDEEGDDGESFWATTRDSAGHDAGKAPADVIGAEGSAEKI